MKATRTVAAAALLASGAVCSQNVTTYGLVDSGVERITNVGPGGRSLTRVPSLSGSYPSRLGFRGSEALGGDLKAVFTLEQGIAPDTGSLNQGGRAWGRTAVVGLAGPWGTMTVGRQYTMLFWSLLEADILGPNIYGTGSLDSYLAGPRADNSLAYKGTFGGVTLGATYSFGRDMAASANCPGEAATDSRACREMSAVLKYDDTSWGVAAGIDRLYGGPGATGGLDASTRSDQRSTVNGYLKLGVAKIAGGWLGRRNEGSATPRSDSWFLEFAYGVTPSWVLDGMLYRLDVRDSDDAATLYALRATCSLSKRTALYATAGYVDNRGTLALSVSSGTPSGTAPVAGGSQSGLMLGMRHSF